MKYYVQPSLGYKTNVLELAISWRLASLNFTKVKNTGVVSGADLVGIQTIQNNPTSFLSEPAVTARLGFKAVKVQAQWGWSSNLSHLDYPQGRSYFSLGVFIAIE